jgi:hypothetical protein
MKTSTEVVYRIGDRVQSLIGKAPLPHEYGDIIAIDENQKYASILWDKDKHKKKPKPETWPLQFVKKFEDDAWNPDHFGEDPPFKMDGNQTTIFYSDEQEPPDPDDFETKEDFENAWAKWEERYKPVNKRELQKEESKQAPEIFLEETILEERGYSVDLLEYKIDESSQAPEIFLEETILEERCYSVDLLEYKIDESSQAPEIFLEETISEQSQSKPRKARHKRGCLYQYLENKRLKTGEVISYPRVIGHRDKDNPKHWRWGFNWEEKIDGAWKGRSIGSIPIGAIPMIQKMQREGVSIWEIIAFIQRSKSKK